MYPVLIRIGSFEITSFGVMVAVAALVGLWLFRKELVRAALPAEAADAGMVGVIGGLVGAKLLWTMEHAGEGPISELLLSRGGLSWYGGLIGGVGAGLVFIVRHKWPVVRTIAAATPALAFGHLIGRIGCLLVGDDYGRPTSLPWGIAFPQGLPPTDVPVHPTQLYEAAGLAILGWLLLRWRQQRRARSDRARPILHRRRRAPVRGRVPASQRPCGWRLERRPPRLARRHPGRRGLRGAIRARSTRGLATLRVTGASRQEASARQVHVQVTPGRSLAGGPVACAPVPAPVWATVFA